MTTSATLQVRIVSVHKVLFSGPAQSVALLGERGMITVLPHHQQLVGTLAPGELGLLDGAAKRHTWSVVGGWFHLQDDVLSLLLLDDEAAG